ncbi:MAG: hypothetical protein F6J92_03415 [Symploca sp. SIO1A3]|nr:hypothetical protein [Symploca sp. SIO1A3]
MSELVEFEQIASSNIYETPKDARPAGWSGYLLPMTTGLPEKIGFESSLTEFEGHYLFSVHRPKLLDSDPTQLATDVLNYIKNNTINRAVLWLKPSVPQDFGEFNSFGFSFLFFLNVYQVTSNMNALVGMNAVFFILQQSRLEIDINRSALRIYASYQAVSPLIGFKDSNGDPLGVSVVASESRINIYIPFSGNNTGCATFRGLMNTSQVFATEVLGPDFRFIVNNRGSGQPEAIFYQTYPIADLPERLNLACTLDLTDPVNQEIGDALLEEGYLRSGFAVSDQPALTSNYRTAGGNTVVLTPLGASAEDMAPPLQAGGFAWASQSQKDVAADQRVVYLGLVGQHGISVNGIAAGKAETLIGGLFGSETLSFVTYDSSKEVVENDRLYILPSQNGYAPTFPFNTANLNRPESGAVEQLLTDIYLTGWSTIMAGASQVEYRAEPEGSALFSAIGEDLAPNNDEVSVLRSTPPRMTLPQGNAFTFPLVPYGAAAKAGVDGNTLTQFESQIIAAIRKKKISENAIDTWAFREQVMAEADVPVSYGTTPQGFVLKLEPESSTYLEVTMAQSANLRHQRLACSPSSTPIPDYLSFSLVRLTSTMQNALQTNQLFLVAVNPTPFTDKNDPLTGACFENVVNIADWTFTAQVGAGATATNYRNVMILKFCSGSLIDRVSNPNRWTSAPEFSLLEGTPTVTAALSYTGLSQWLQDYIHQGVELSQGRSGAFYKNFAQIATDPDWQGVIVLAADLSAANLPPEIAGIAAGIDFTRFAAHHFGFTATRVSVDKATGQISIAPGDSSLFALIDYENPRYASNLELGLQPDLPIPVTTEDDFDFTVLQLQSLFENAKLTLFSSHIQLTVDRLLSSPITQIYNGGQVQPANGIVLKGSYINQGGQATYVFKQDSASVLHSESNVLPAIAFNRVQFNTVGEKQDGAGTMVVSRFLIWGAFDFVPLQSQNDQLLDVLSFGSDANTPKSELGVGLAFSNLVLNMSFPKATPNAKKFVLDTDNQAWDLNASTFRKESLFAGFGLQLKSFVNATGNQKPSELGFLPVTSQLQLTELDGPWFGVVYELTLGGPGALASGVGFQSQYLAAWSPSSTGDSAERAVFLGMSLPGTAPGASLFSLQGVFKVAVGSISILRQPVPKTQGREAEADEFFYCLRINDIGIKIFGITKLPPSANIQFFLFGDPNNTGSLGWYAAYVAEDNPGCNQSLAFAEIEPREALL